MLNVTKELTALARKLGYTGKAPDTVAKAINAITASVGEGGSEGGSLIVPTFTEKDEGESYSYSCDMTFASVNAAIEAGKCCNAYMNGNVYHLMEFNDERIAFANIYDDRGLTFTFIYYSPDGIFIDTIAV